MEHLKNFRDLGDYSKGDGRRLRRGVFARCDNPYGLPKDEVDELKAMGFCHVIDLRRDGEIEIRPDALAQCSGFVYHHISMNDAPYLDFGPLDTAEQIAAAYFSKLTVSASSIAAVFHLFASAETGVLFHCESGKDRTGTIAALLLLLNDVADEVNIADYHLSYIRLYLENNDGWLADSTLIPKGEVMEAFLKTFHQAYPTADDYFLSIGLHSEELAAIRKKWETVVI